MEYLVAQRGTAILAVANHGLEARATSQDESPPAARVFLDIPFRPPVQ